MDDWISRVYGVQRTLRADVVEVVHHTGKHGQRYQVDKSHASLLQGLIESGAAKIAAHVEASPAAIGLPPRGFSRFAFTGKKPAGGMARRARPRAHGRGQRGG